MHEARWPLSNPHATAEPDPRAKHRSDTDEADGTRRDDGCWELESARMKDGAAQREMGEVRQARDPDQNTQSNAGTCQERRLDAHEQPDPTLRDAEPGEDLGPVLADLRDGPGSTDKQHEGRQDEEPARHHGRLGGRGNVRNGLEACPFPGSPVPVERDECPTLAQASAFGRPSVDPPVRG